jgi:hypothetical protein
LDKDIEAVDMGIEWVGVGYLRIGESKKDGLWQVNLIEKGELHFEPSLLQKIIDVGAI